MPPSTHQCPDEANCELSQEISNALERFSLPHQCKWATAKSLLVDKVRHFYALSPALSPCNSLRMKVC